MDLENDELREAHDAANAAPSEQDAEYLERHNAYLASRDAAVIAKDRLAREGILCSAGKCTLPAIVEKDGVALCGTHFENYLMQKSANDAHAEDAADLEYFGSMPLEHCCSVNECERPGAEFRVAPRDICDPGEEERWPVVHFCPLHMREITGGNG